MVRVTVYCLLLVALSGVVVLGELNVQVPQCLQDLWKKCSRRTIRANHPDVKYTRCQLDALSVSCVFSQSPCAEEEYNIFFVYRLFFAKLVKAGGCDQINTDVKLPPGAAIFLQSLPDKQRVDLKKSMPCSGQVYTKCRDQGRAQRKSGQPFCPSLLMKFYNCLQPNPDCPAEDLAAFQAFKEDYVSVFGPVFCPGI